MCMRADARPRAGLAGLGGVGMVCPPSALGISFSLGTFTLSPGSLREEPGTQLSALRSGRKPDGGNRGVQIPKPLQQLAGEMWGTGKWGGREGGRARAPTLGRAGGPE